MAFTMNAPELLQVGNQPVFLDIPVFSAGSAKQPVFLRWSRTRERSKKSPGALWVCKACMLRAKILREWLKKSILKEKNRLFLQSSF